MAQKHCTKKAGKIIKIDEGEVRSHVGEVVRTAVEETLNTLLSEEADRLCNARRYERTDGRRDTRAGNYQRKLQTTSGEVTLNVPKLRTPPFETAIIERYRRKQISVEEALVEMYLAAFLVSYLTPEITSIPLTLLVYLSLSAAILSVMSDRGVSLDEWSDIVIHLCNTYHKE